MAEQQVQPLHNEKHANIKVKNGVNVDFLKTQHLMPVSYCITSANFL